MPRILKDNQVLLQCAVDVECRERFDRLMAELAASAPEEEKHNFRSRPAFINWLLDKVYYITESERRLSIRKKELSEWEEELRQREEKLAEANARLHEGLRYLRKLAGNGYTKDDILAIARILKDAGLDPQEVVKAIEEAGGVIKWLRRVSETYTDLAQSLANLKDQVTAHRMAVAKLQEQEKEIENRISSRMTEFERATLAVARVCATARDLGLYIEYIQQSCKANNAERIQDLLPEPALVLSGTILEAVASAYGDREVTIPPGAKHLLPVQVTLREIARSLAPSEAYQEQQRAQFRMQVQAEMAASGQ